MDDDVNSFTLLKVFQENFSSFFPQKKKKKKLRLRPENFGFERFDRKREGNAVSLHGC
jgi:hypothetical protein